MKSTSLKKIGQTPHLQLIKNSTKKFKRTSPKVRINTLIPGFNYSNSKGEVMRPSTHSIL